MNCFRAIVVAGFSLLCSFAIRAEEAAKPRAESPPEDSITSAKKSFESLARKHPTEERGVLELPRLAAPEFNVGVPSAQELSQTKDIAKPSKNWLVEGVISKPAYSERGSTSSSARRSDPTDSKKTEALDEAEIGSAAANPEVSPSRDQAAPRVHSSPSTEVVNPLASFMEGWISAQDRTLLLPIQSQDSHSPNAEGSLANLTTSPAGATSFESGSLNQPVFKSPVQENPYLAPGATNSFGSIAESAPSRNLQNLPPTGLKSLDPVVRAPVSDSMSSTPSKPTARDLAKPDDNAKYFKQLKRF